MAENADRLAVLFQSIAEEPEDPLGHYLLALELAKLGRGEGAIPEFRKAIELKPDYTAAYRDLGKSLRDLGRKEEAAAAFEEGLAVSERTHDVQTAKEIRVFLRRMDRGP